MNRFGVRYGRVCPPGITRFRGQVLPVYTISPPRKVVERPCRRNHPVLYGMELPFHRYRAVNYCLAAFVLPVRACRTLSRRDGMKVAWHEMPGKTCPKGTRPVGYGMFGAVSSKDIVRPNYRRAF